MTRSTAAPTVGRAPAPSPWAPLRNPIFRAIFLASLITQVARWMHDTSAAWFMTTMTDSPLPVALMQTAVTLPIFVFALPAGVLADLVDRRRWLIGAQLWLLASAGVLGTLTLLGVMRPWLLLSLTFAIGIGTALNMPAMEAIIPELVPKHELAGAVALKGVTVNVARAVGPAIGGTLLALAGPAPVFLLNAGAFGVVALVLVRWRGGARAATPTRVRFSSALRTGLRYARFSPALSAVLLRTAAFLVGASALWALMPLVARDAGMGPTGYGLLLAAVGSGAVTGVLLMPRWRDRYDVDVFLGAAMIATAGVVAAFALLDTPLPLLVVGFVGGLGWIAYAITMNTVAQQVLPDWVRARGLAVYIIVQQGAMAASAAVWGVVASVGGVPTALLAAAGVLVLGLGMIPRWRLDAVSRADLAPAPTTVDPPPWAADATTRGRVLVTVTYRVAPADAEAFRDALSDLGRIRRRDGALRWRAWSDLDDSERHVETFVVESFAEHVRQHGRRTAADRQVEQRVRELLVPGARPEVAHHLAHRRPRRR